MNFPPANASKLRLRHRHLLFPSPHIMPFETALILSKRPVDCACSIHSCRGRAPCPARQERLGLALSSIARTLAESLELKVVFSRVAEAVRQVLPFDVMGISVVRDLDVPWEDLENVTFSAFAVAGEP